MNRFMRFLQVFRGFYNFSRFFNFHDPQIKKQKIENFRFSQNRFKIYLDGQYGYKHDGFIVNQVKSDPPNFEWLYLCNYWRYGKNKNS